VFISECDRHKIQPLYKKALISLNIFLSKGIRDKREIQPFYKKALIFSNIFLIKCDNSHSLIVLTFVSKCEFNQKLLQKRVTNSLESFFVVRPLLICEATTNQC
jgi:hypothetical protein